MMGYWFDQQGPWAVHPERMLRVDPDRRYAHWYPGPNAYCAYCNQRTAVLYAVPFRYIAGSDAVCRACAAATMKD